MSVSMESVRPAWGILCCELGEPDAPEGVLCRRYGAFVGYGTDSEEGSIPTQVRTKIGYLFSLVHCCDIGRPLLHSARFACGLWKPMLQCS